MRVDAKRSNAIPRSGSKLRAACARPSIPAETRSPRLTWLGTRCAISEVTYCTSARFVANQVRSRTSHACRRSCWSSRFPQPLSLPLACKWCRPCVARILESTSRLIRRERVLPPLSVVAATLARAREAESVERRGRFAVVVDELALVRLGLATLLGSLAVEPRVDVVAESPGRAGGRRAAPIARAGADRDRVPVRYAGRGGGAPGPRPRRSRRDRCPARASGSRGSVAAVAEAGADGVALRGAGVRRPRRGLHRGAGRAPLRRHHALVGAGRPARIRGAGARGRRPRPPDLPRAGGTRRCSPAGRATGRSRRACRSRRHREIPSRRTSTPSSRCATARRR